MWLLTFPIILLLAFLVVLSFFFSVSETSLIGLNKIRLHHMVAKGVKGALTVHKLVLNLDKVIAAILIGNNFVNIAISAIVTAIFVEVFNHNIAILLATFVTTITLLVFCEITPKILATKHPEKISLITAPIMERLIVLLNPLVMLFTGVSHFLLCLLRIKPGKRSPLVTQEELRLMIEVGKDEGVLTDQERKMLHRIFEFGGIKVSEVMAPKDKIIAVNIGASTEELLNIFAEQGHARLPVYKENIDNIVGIIYARDLLYVLKDKGLFLLQDLIHPACFINAYTRVNDVLLKFQADKIQMAIVTDEEKKTIGVVTLEDLMEEIVGEIEEKHPDYT